MCRFNTKRIVAVPTLLVAMVLAGCGHTAGPEVTKGAGERELDQVTEMVVARDCNETRINSHSSCMDLAEAILQLGESVYDELKPADDSPGAGELTNDLDTFIKQRRTPTNYNREDTEEASPP